jgi:hypothetical protein
MGKVSFDGQASGVGCWYVGITNYLVNFFGENFSFGLELKFWGQMFGDKIYLLRGSI